MSFCNRVTGPPDTARCGRRHETEDIAKNETPLREGRGKQAKPRKPRILETGKLIVVVHLSSATRRWPPKERSTCPLLVGQNPNLARSIRVLLNVWLWARQNDEISVARTNKPARNFPRGRAISGNVTD